MKLITRSNNEEWRLEIATIFITNTKRILSWTIVFHYPKESSWRDIFPRNNYFNPFEEEEWLVEVERDKIINDRFNFKKN